MNRVFFFFVQSFFFCGFCVAQQSNGVLTLKQCIDAALQNNVQVKQGNLQVQAAGVNARQAKANLLPTVNGNVSHGINQGRSIDPFTNAYINQQINYASYSLGSNIVLFSGASLQHTIRQNAYTLDATRMDVQQVKDNLTLSTILAYLQVLNNEDRVELTKSQMAVTQKQVERLEILNSQGAVSPPLLYELRGQLKSDELAVIANQNAVQTSRLALTQLMNISYDTDLKVERLPLEESLTKYGSSAGEVYQKAVNGLAVVKAAQFRRKSAESAWKAVKGELYPSLLLGGNLNSNFSSAATRDILVNTSETPTSNYVLVNGSKIPVIVQQSNYNSEKIGYSSQLKNNLFSSIGLSLRIPLFNSFQTRNRIKLAKIQVRNNEVLEEDTKFRLHREIDQAYINLNSAWDSYKTLLDQVAAYAQAFRAAEVRFNAGAGTSVDYIIAKNNLDGANMNLLSAKYDYVLRKKILDYYNQQQIIY